MSCSKLIGKAILCVLLFGSFVVANNIVTTDAKQNTNSNAENDADFSNYGEAAVLGTASPSTTKSSDDVLKSDDLNTSKDGLPFNKYNNNSSALSISNTKSISDVIVNGGVVEKDPSGYIQNSRATLGTALLDGGILKSKDIDDVLSPKSADGYIPNTRATISNGLGIEGGVLKTKDMDGYIPNTRATEESMFGINGGVLNAKDMGGYLPARSGYIPNIQSMVGINQRVGNIIQTEGRPDCSDGYVADCSGDGDCCPESWIGDGFGDCEDQAYGCDLTCYGNDGGDCGGGTSTTTTTSGGGANLIATFNVTYDWYCSGSYGSTTVDFYDDYSAVFAGAYPGTWGYGSGTTSFDDGLCSGGDLDVGYWFQFDNYATMYSWSQSGCGYHDDIAYNGSGNTDGVTMLIDYVSDVSECYGGGDSSTTTTTTGGCPDGYVDDCSGDGDCCSASWIGDGFADCEDQAFGCDLTCYGNDGGDCDDATTTTTTTTTSGGGCPDGYVDDCSGDGDCCAESWIGDGFGDCEDQAYGCDLTCYGNDGGDCGGGTSTTTTTSGGGAELIASYNITYDWYCSGSWGTATVDFYDDYSAVLEGSYPGTWGYTNAASYADGLCSGGDLGDGYFFEFDNYATRYTWDQTGCGYHDDMGYNGEGDVDGVTMLIDYVADTSACYGGDDTTTTTTTTSGGGCPDGYVDDCSGDGDCCAESWIGDGFADCEDQAYGCDLTCYDNDGGDCGPDCQDGDINCDGALDVIDVVLMVNAIIAGDTLDGGDLNGDGSLDVIDVVILVNSIIDGRAMDADNATMVIADNSLRVSADGYIGGIQMTLSHGQGFELNLTDNAMVSEYKTTGTSTILVVVVPEDELIFTANQSFEVEKYIIANSEGKIEVDTVSEFGLSAAYPNPFNPSTTVTLTVPSADFVSVKVYNLVGQVVGVLAEGMMDANTYKFTWNASDMSSGVYMIRAESGSNVDIQKVLLVK